MIRRPDVHATAPAAIAAGGNIESASTTNIGIQVLGVSAVPVAAAAKDPGPVFTAVGVETFTGRGWLWGEVDRFIDANPSGYVFVEAEAGLGKTAFAAWLVKTRGYLSHFSRYSGGRSVRSALQNLSAQLVREFGLGDQAPGGMLPEWAQTPAGFESVLGMAAARARHDGRRLVLVVDGLDEAEPSEDGLAFGLPVLLPDGVYVIGTNRPGRSPGRPDTPSVTLQISKTDLRNSSDIREYLTQAVVEEILAARLAESSISPADFIEVLTERSNGVWVYLRYVLQEVRIGLRLPGTISDLPSGLWDYYADQIRGWQKDPAWQESLLPLVATLGVAGDPLPAAVLARLAGDLDPVAVRRWCDFTFRPLLTTTRSTAAGSPLQYEIYHASFRELLKALPSEGAVATGSNGRSYEFEVLSDELRHATLSAHARIADSYLTAFGGFDAGLPVLAGEPVVAGIDDGYPLRHLARHLHHAGRAAELHRLLAVAHPDNSGCEVNVWFSAHDHADCLASYIDDLARARNISATATDDALARRQRAASLGTEIRYTLMAASIVSRAIRISPELLELLAQTGLWSPERGLDHARRLAEPFDRFQALFAVHPYVTTAEDSLILEEALAAATAISPEYQRAEALAALAPHLPPGQMGQALAAATAISYEKFRAEALTALAPHLAPGQQADVLGQALAAATAIDHKRDRAEALTALAPHLPPGQQADVLGQALAAAIAISFEYYRAEALAALAPHLAPGQLGQALAAATVISHEHYRAFALAALAPYLPPGQQADILGQALAAATAIDDDEYYRARALAALAPYLPPGQQADVLGQALAAATAISPEYQRAEALAALAPHLAPGQLGQALAAATAISHEYQRAEALTALAPHLPPGQMGQALAAATAINDKHFRARALSGLAPHLPPGQQAGILGQALAAATAISDEYYRARALSGLAPHLPPGQQAGILGQALAAATAISDEYYGAEALNVAFAISDEYYRAEALTAVASHLPPGQQAGILGQALAAATAISHEYYRAEALTALAPHLPPGQLGQALAAATAIDGDYSRAEALTALAPHLPPGQQAGILGQALAAATAIDDEHYRAEALAALAPHLPPGQQAGILGQALATATAISRGYPRAEALAALAPRLSPGQVGRALAAATAISDEYYRAEALAALAPHLPPGQLGRALAAATAISDQYHRAEALTALAPHLPPGQQAGILGQALAAATAIDDEHYRARALTALAPHLPPGQQAGILGQALAAATAIDDECYRAEALTALAPHLPPGQQADILGQALAAASAMADDYSAGGELVVLAPNQPPYQLGQARRAIPKRRSETIAALLERGRSVLSSTGNEKLPGLLRISLRGADRRSCLSVISLMAPSIARIGGVKAIQECESAIVDAHRWWP